MYWNKTSLLIISNNEKSIIELAKKIRIILQTIKPKYSFFCEGDAPYNPLVSELSNSLKIKSICIQWGIFLDNKKRVGFSNIQSNYVFVWGKYFAKEVQPINPKSKVKIYGYPNKDHKLVLKKKSKKIVFLGQSVDKNYIFRTIILNSYYTKIF